MKKTIGLALMVLGVAGFIGGNILKSKSQVLAEKVASKGPRVVELQVIGHKSYTVFLWGRDEESASSPTWAQMEFAAKIVGADGSTVLFEEPGLVASASSAEESGGVKRAQNGCEYTGTARSNGTWKIHVDLKDGDEVTIDAYEDLPTILNLAPGLAIIGGVIGLVLFLRGRAAQ